MGPSCFQQCTAYSTDARRCIMEAGSCEAMAQACLGLCACDETYDCDTGCGCGPDCGSGCDCDTTGACESECGCDPDCGSTCLCDMTCGCDQGCLCDPQCGQKPTGESCRCEGEDVVSCSDTERETSTCLWLYGDVAYCSEQCDVDDPSTCPGGFEYAEFNFLPSCAFE